MNSVRKVTSSAPRLLYLILVCLFTFCPATQPALASACGLIYPGALTGPPPEWTFWADGSACYVRWQSSGIPEERLFEKCRGTRGARFVHFEPDRGAGSICIFKLHNLPDTPPAETNQAVDHPAHKNDFEQGLQSTHYRKTDAETPVLDDLQSLVTSWTQRCLEKEEKETEKGAASCWKAGAKALVAFASGRGTVLPLQFASNVSQLQDAWLRRSAQLEATLVSVRVENDQKKQPQVDAEIPISTHDGPDPRRLAETASCSSTSLGDMRRCLAEPRSSAPERYYFGLRSGCASIIAAVKTYDASGRCIRKVIAIKSGKNRSAEIMSYAEPAVLDAISYKGRAVLECYARRHDQISCDGKTDYASATAATVPQPPVAEKQAVRVKRNYRLQYEKEDGSVKSGRKDETVFDSFSSRLKTLLRPDK